MTPLLQIEDLHVWFELEEGAGELHAVQGVNLELAAGERLEQGGHRASDAERVRRLFEAAWRCYRRLQA